MSGWAWVRIGAVLGFLAVGLGAFGAHSLKDQLEASEMTATYQTAAHYQMDHALAIVAVGLLGIWRSGQSGRRGRRLGVSWPASSSSREACTRWRSTGVTKLGMITPFGGLAFLVGMGRTGRRGERARAARRDPDAHWQDGRRRVVEQPV